jgi:hypothetical protein
LAKGHKATEPQEARALTQQTAHTTLASQPVSPSVAATAAVPAPPNEPSPAQYNYELSQRRADAVVQYLASKYSIPAHRFYLIGIGKDKEVAPNTTAEGRKQNRRVSVRLLENTVAASTQTATVQ